jgi:hypothetical protein
MFIKWAAARGWTMQMWRGHLAEVTWGRGIPRGATPRIKKLREEVIDIAGAAAHCLKV